MKKAFEKNVEIKIVGDLRLLLLVVLLKMGGVCNDYKGSTIVYG